VWSRRALAILYSALAMFVAAVVLFTTRNRPAPRHPRLASEPASPEARRVVTGARAPVSPAEAAPVEPAGAAPRIAMPIAGLKPSDLRDSFAEIHGGVIVKKLLSVPGGITVYQFNPDRTLCYYYAHLERYAEPLAEGQSVVRGDTIGFVGTSGNAPPQTPHLHFAVYVLGPERRWWEGTAIDPYPLLLKARPAP
jgi:hypothetical protein